VGAFPISIDSTAVDSLARSRETLARAARLRDELGSPRVLMLGVDRLDYTKGIDVRLRALEELFEEGRLHPSEVTLLQLATPSRERAARCQTVRGGIGASVSGVMARVGEFGQPVVTCPHRPVPKTELTACDAAADVMRVTPARDGMNLVAKEYVATC